MKKKHHCNKKGSIFCFSSVTNGGKTTLTDTVKQALGSQGICVHTIHQDDYFKVKNTFRSDKLELECTVANM